ncbi:MAG: four helix bundle protein [Bacteroidetes bacterium]|nr:MAG: four helix bundle protein [Bacteroidota bacterium]
MIYSFRDMDVWKEAFDLAILVHEHSSDFPISEQFALSSQLRRAAVSTFSNIAEGYGRPSSKEKIRYYQIARASMYELEAQLEYAQRVSYLRVEDYSILEERIKKW